MQTPEDKRRMQESEYAQCRRDKELLQTALQQAERERDTALARVKELEADKAIIIEARDQAGIGWATAETALASAHTLLTDIAGYFEQFSGEHIRIASWLTSHPAPASNEHECDNNDCQRCHHIGALPAPVAAPCADDPCHHCGKQLRYSHTITPQFPGSGMQLESCPIYRCDDGHEFERLERRPCKP